MKSIIRNIIIIVAVIALGVVGYKVFFSSKSTSTGALQTTAGVGTPTAGGAVTASADGSVSGDALGHDFLVLLLSVRSIHIDSSLFKDKAFLVLQDFNRKIPPDTDPGRVNPFAPIGTDGGSGAVTVAKVTTSNPSSIKQTGAAFNGTLETADTNTTRWFDYGTTTFLGTMTPPKTQLTPGAFTETVTGLLPNTTYYVQSSALVGGVTIHGNTVTWKTAQGGTQKQTSAAKK
jgi:hypothetical protein